MLITKLNKNYNYINKRVSLSTIFDKLKAYNLKMRHEYDYILTWLPSITEIRINKTYHRFESEFEFQNGESITIDDKELYNIFADFMKQP